MIQYDLGSLRCAVHAAVDARLPDPHQEPAAVSTEWFPPHRKDGSGTDSIHKVSAKRESSVARLTVANNQRFPDRFYSMSRHWFSREDYLIGGVHTHGTLTGARWRPLKGHRLSWEGRYNQQMSLRKLVTLLHKLREIMQSTEKKRAILHWSQIEHAGEIRVYHSTSDEKLLPDELIERCWSKIQNGAEPQKDHPPSKEHPSSPEENPPSAASVHTSLEVVELCWMEAENRARPKGVRSETWPKPYARRSVYPA